MIGNKTVKDLIDRYDIITQLLEDMIPDFAWENEEFHASEVVRLKTEVRTLGERILYVKRQEA